MLAKHFQAPRCTWKGALSLEIFASKLAPTGGISTSQVQHKRFVRAQRHRAGTHRAVGVVADQQALFAGRVDHVVRQLDFAGRAVEVVQHQQAFAMALGDLLEMPSASSSVKVIRGDDRAFHYRSDKFCRLRTLSPLNLEKDVEFYEVQLQPTGALRSAAHFEGTREFITVVKGFVNLESGGDTDTLHHGDSANYRADVPHAIINTGKNEAVMFLVVIYR